MPTITLPDGKQLPFDSPVTGRRQPRRSGCGKTTLISVVAGVLDRDGGECAVFGTDFDRLGASERTRFRGRNIGFVFQAFNLIPTLSSAENVAVPLLINGVSRKESIERARVVLAKVGRGDRTGDPTLTDWRRDYLKEEYGKPGAVFLHPAPRLDRPGSGAVLFARTDKALGRLTTLFREKQVAKTYLALTC